MGRTKGSKNGVRKASYKKPKQIVREVEEQFIYEADDADPCEEQQDPNLPIFDDNVLKAYQSKSYERCIHLAEKILLVNTDDNKDHYKILQAGAYTMLGGKFDAAHSILDEVLAGDPTNAYAMYGKGVAFYFDKNYNAAVAMFEKAIVSRGAENFDRARDMIMRIDLERRSAVIMVEKMSDTESVGGCNFDEEQDDILQDSSNKPISFIKVSSDPLIEPDEDQKENIQSSRLSDRTPSVASTKSFETIPEIPESLPKSFNPSTADEYFEKGMELYMVGALKKSLKMFEKSIKLDPKNEKAEEMGAKAQALQELLDMAAMNMNQKNYSAVVQIINEALEIDETNHYINRPFYFQRGLALYYLGKNQESVKDYAEFDRINKILTET